MFSDPKVIVPVLVVRLTPVLPEPLAFVLPKLSEPLDVLTEMPVPVGFVIVVVGLVRFPATLVRLMPVVVLFVDEILTKVAASVPLLRLRAWPAPLRVTSEIVRVPNTAPVISVPALPPVKPVRRLPVATVIALPALVMFTMVPLPLLVVGKGSLSGGGVRPVIDDSVPVASCPINFCPVSSVTGPT